MSPQTSPDEGSGPVVVTPETAALNLSPYAFHVWATQYLQVMETHPFGDYDAPVLYHLLCLSIELEVKSRLLLRGHSQNELKDEFGHQIGDAYKALPQEERILDEREVLVLDQASGVYVRKLFDYWSPRQALEGFRDFPALDQLHRIATKLNKAGDAKHQ
ncbi:MAG TPA: hypothetical protein VI876_03605 [Dehalococcoidia bacterium]|nr:hypothetical protein [Dehalococcoidia bacterium]